jgi:hypothetical protein
MCSITASRDSKKLIELMKLNSHRGTVSSSLTIMNLKHKPHTNVPHNPDPATLPHRQAGPLNTNIIHYGQDKYGIVHQAAPTQAINVNNIHPSYLSYSLLWHNGILKQSYMDDHAVGIYKDWWDTRFLQHKHMQGLDLGVVDGSFACLFMNPSGLFAFRNELCNLYVDDDLNVSSVKFDDAENIPAGMVLYFDFKTSSLNHNGVSFKTKEMPYYIPGEE